MAFVPTRVQLIAGLGLHEDSLLEATAFHGAWWEPAALLPAPAAFWDFLGQSAEGAEDFLWPLRCRLRA
eukprot:7182466-Alexandrium_andersonii.AAC.1